MIEHNFSVLDHKILLREDLKEECNEDIPLDRMRLRRKTLKQPAQILLDDMIFGRDAFINTSSELCVEILNGIFNFSLSLSPTNTFYVYRPRNKNR